MRALIRRAAVVLLGPAVDVAEAGGVPAPAASGPPAGAAPKPACAPATRPPSCRRARSLTGPSTVGQQPDAVAVDATLDLIYVGNHGSLTACGRKVLGETISR
jgi:hypothetical protein